MANKNLATIPSSSTRKSWTIIRPLEQSGDTLRIDMMLTLNPILLLTSSQMTAPQRENKVAGEIHVFLRALEMIQETELGKALGQQMVNPLTLRSRRKNKKRLTN